MTHSPDPLPRLIHVHDPMCSWCWAFRLVWAQLRAQLPATLTVQRRVGGLAPDSDLPMEPAMQAKLQAIWRSIELRVPGTRFNHDFWTRCTPRRSTYPACRAVLLARQMNPDTEEAMVQAIQEAYYLQARNPSDTSTLVALAESLGLDAAAFDAALSSPALDEALHAELAAVRRLPIQGFPSLVLQTARGVYPIALDYLDAAPMLQQIEVALKA
ncbi:DsbA family protein [Rhodoferax sp.]|uniref:DsbA family protein n=1 Tax=Rhodoferax sp. TaxID=50421 RepID=UPI0025D58157|nr:DsbA family protein [Rhodoferax sp.]